MFSTRLLPLAKSPQNGHTPRDRPAPWPCLTAGRGQAQAWSMKTKHPMVSKLRQRFHSGHRPHPTRWPFCLVLAGLLGYGSSVVAAEDHPLAHWQRPADWDEIVADEARLDQYRAPRPTEFAFVFSFGYAGDDMPADDAAYERLLQMAKATGHNVIHTQFTEAKRELCRAYGIKMMIQFLDEEHHHVYKSPDKAEAVARLCEGDPIVWGYNIWNDRIARRPDQFRAGRRRDIRTVRTWDPSHPAYVGEYRMESMRHIPNGDCPGYYDFHWSRGIGYHFGHLSGFRSLARENNSIFYTWLGAGSGTPGEDNFRKNLWSVNTGIAFGLKGVLWFLSTPGVVDKDTLEYGVLKDDIQQIHERISPPLRRELMKIGLPEPVYGTSITRDMVDQPVEPGPMPGVTPIPADFWAQPVSGEFVMGLFQHDDGDEVLYVANYNALAPQSVKIRLNGRNAALAFDTEAGEYKPLALADGCIEFPLEAAGGLLLRIK